MLKVTPSTVYDSAGSAKCGELFCQGSSGDFTILCAFCELKFLEYDVFLLHFKNVHFEKNYIRNTRYDRNSKKKAEANLGRRPSLLTELVMVQEASDDEENMFLKDTGTIDDKATKREKGTYTTATTQINKKEINELRSQLQAELKVDLQKIEQRILVLENEINSKKREQENEGIISVTLPKYAFRNVQHFKTYEQLFQNNDKRFAELVSQFLHHVEVENPLQFVKLCWRKILQDKAAQHLCWRGTSTKQAISSSVITAAIRDAYVSKFPQNSSDIEFEKTCIVYFQKAKMRFELQSSRWQRSR